MGQEGGWRGRSVTVRDFCNGTGDDDAVALMGRISSERERCIRGWLVERESSCTYICMGLKAWMLSVAFCGRESVHLIGMGRRDTCAFFHFLLKLSCLPV